MPKNIDKVGKANVFAKIIKLIILLPHATLADGVEKPE